MKKLFFLGVLGCTLAVGAFAQSVVIGAYDYPGFQPANLNMATTTVTVSVATGSNIVTSAGAFRAQWVGIGGQTVEINGARHYVSAVRDTSTIFLTTAYAGATTVSATMKWFPYVEVRLFRDKAFQANQAAYITQPGALQNSPWFKRYGASVINENGQNILRVPEMSLEASTNGVPINTAVLTKAFFTAGNGINGSGATLISVWQCANKAQFRLPPGTPTTWTEICNYNNTVTVASNNTTYTADQINQFLPNCPSAANGSVATGVYYAQSGRTLSCLTFGQGFTRTGNVLSVTGGGGGGGGGGNAWTSLGWINPVDYGADPAGVSDSTTAFQSAINAMVAVNNRKPLYIPPGYYTITGVLNLPLANQDSTFVMFGAGPSASMINFTGTGNLFQGPSGRCDNWRFESFTVYVNNPSNTGNIWDFGVAGSVQTHITFRDLYTQSAGGWTIYARNMQSSLIDNCHFRAAKKGHIAFDDDNLADQLSAPNANTIKHSLLDNLTYNGMAVAVIYGYGANGTTIEDCTIQGHWSGAGADKPAIYLKSSTGGVIKNVHIESPNSNSEAGILLEFTDGITLVNTKGSGGHQQDVRLISATGTTLVGCIYQNAVGNLIVDANSKGTTVVGGTFANPSSLRLGDQSVDGVRLIGNINYKIQNGTAHRFDWVEYARDARVSFHNWITNGSFTTNLSGWTGAAIGMTRLATGTPPNNTPAVLVDTGGLADGGPLAGSNFIQSVSINDTVPAGPVTLQFKFYIESFGVTPTVGRYVDIQGVASQNFRINSTDSPTWQAGKWYVGSLRGNLGAGTSRSFGISIIATQGPNTPRVRFADFEFYPGVEGIRDRAALFAGIGGVGTVTSVGLSLPNDFTVSGSPVTASGTLTAAWASKTANQILASPNGSSGTPVFRTLVEADLPTLSGAGKVNVSALTGTLSAAQFPAHTGDVTSSAGSLSLAIANSAVTYAKIQNVTANRLLGRESTNGVVQELQIGSGLSLSSGVLTATGGGGSLTIQDETVSQGTATTLNFAGAGVTAAVSAGTATITIPGGGGSAFTATLVNANYTTLNADRSVSMDASGGARTVTFLAASGNSGVLQRVCKRDTSTNTVTVTAGGLSFTLYGPGSCTGWIMSDGTNWIEQ